MNIQEALAAVRDNPNSEGSSLPWSAILDQVQCLEGWTANAYSKDNAACIAARVNSAPVLAAEVERLQGLLDSTGVDQIDGGWKTMVGNSIGLGATPRDAIEAVIDAEVHRRLAAARVAVEALHERECYPSCRAVTHGHSCTCGAVSHNDDITEARRAVGLEESNG